MKKFSMRSLIAVVVCCTMIVSTLCIGGLTAAAENVYTDTTTVVDLSKFASAAASSIEANVKALKITVLTGNTNGGNGTNALNNTVLGLETGKNYVFWLNAKGTNLSGGDFYFETKNSANTVTDKIHVNLNSGLSATKWKKLTAVSGNASKYPDNYLTMDSTVTACFWLKNTTENDIEININSITYAEYDVEKSAVVAGTEKTIDVTKFNKTSITTVESYDLVNDLATDKDNEKLAISVAGSDTNENGGTTTVSGLTKGKKYQLSMYVKGDAFTNANIRIKDTNDQGTQFSSTTISKGYEDWTKITTPEFTALSDTAFIGLWFNNKDNAATGNFYVDHMVIKDVTDSVTLSGFSNGATVTSGGVDSDNECLEVVAKAASATSKTNLTVTKKITGLEKGKLYSVSAWVKSEVCDGGNIFFNAKIGGTEVKFNTIATNKNVTEWTKVTRDSVMAGDDGSITVGLWIRNADTAATRTAWLDELTVSAQKTFDLQGASIRTETENQDLKFNMSLSSDGIVADDWNITEYGVIFVPQQRFGTKIDAEAELTLELAEQYPQYIIVSGQEVTDGALPANVSFTLNGSSSTPILNGGSSCGVKICARAYYKYTYTANLGDGMKKYEGVIYSDNNLNGTETNTGALVEGGIATRSVYGIARSMAAKILEKDGFTPAQTDLVQSCTDGKFYDADGLQVKSADVLKFVVDNASHIYDIVE